MGHFLIFHKSLGRDGHSIHFYMQFQHMVARNINNLVSRHVQLVN